MLRLSHVFVCGVLLSVMGSSSACNITLASIPALQGLVGSPLECLVTDLLCLLQPIVNAVSELVGLVLLVVLLLLQLIEAVGFNVATFVDAFLAVIRQALTNSAIAAVVRRLLLRIPVLLSSVIQAVVQFLS